MSSDDKPKGSDKGIWVSQDEYEQLKKQIISFSDFQRLSSVLLWIGMAMILLHIAADIFFHID
jgi:hypothetical protein